MEASEATSRGTDYVVLEKRSVDSPSDASEKQANEFWVERSNVKARSSREAVAAYVKQNGSQGGVFAAVPIRSWNEVTVATETQTRLTFS